MEHGVFSRGELASLGMAESQVRRAVRAGDLIRLRSGWFARPDADPFVASAVRKGGVLGCVSALKRHGVWIAPGYDAVHVRAGKSLRGSLPRSCRPSGPPRPASTAVDPIDVALSCAARCMTAEHWIAACDSAVEAGLVERADLTGVLNAGGRTLLAKCDENSQSGTESIVRVRLRALRFGVVVQPKISGVGKVDLRVGKLLIECDSKTHHTSLANYQNDRRRDRCALVRRYMTMRVTYDDVLYGWDDVLADVQTITRADRHRIRGKHRPLEG